MVNHTRTDSAGGYRLRFALSGYYILPEDGVVPCVVRLAWRLHPSVPAHAIPARFARNISEVVATDVPPLVERYTAAQAGQPGGGRLLPVEFAAVPLYGDQPTPDTSLRAFAGPGEIRVTGVLPAPESPGVYAWVGRAELRGSGDVVLYLLAEAASRGSTVLLPHRFEAVIRDVPAGRYAVGVHVLRADEPWPDRRPAHPARTLDGVLVPGG
ncbi:MAG TPA: hypothetical protein VF746_06705 [Longimicrobium sp.]|jgi:hypothetical protein